MRHPADFDKSKSREEIVTCGCAPERLIPLRELECKPTRRKSFSMILLFLFAGYSCDYYSLPSFILVGLVYFSILVSPF